MRRLALVASGLLLACDGGDDGSPSVSATNQTSASASQGNGTTGDGPSTSTSSASATTTTTASVSSTSTTASEGSSTGDAPKFDLPAGTTETGGPETTPVRMLPGLVSITFYERTGGAAPTDYTFTVNGPELSVRLVDPLTDANFDISGAAGEFYDVYYSDIDGNEELDGLYLTISGIFSTPGPAGGGLNLAEIGLNFEGAPTEFGNYVASYAILGDNAVQPDGNVNNAIDGDLQSHTTMGNTVGAAERLRVTLGFLSSSGPPPG